MEISMETFVDKMYASGRPRTLWALFRHTAERVPERECFVFESGAWTYGRVLEQSRRAAKSLLALGVVPGDRVALLLRNCPSFLIVTFALAAIGAVRVPIQASAGEEELGYVLRHTQAKLIVSNRPLPAKAVSDLPARLMCVRVDEQSLGIPGEGEWDWEGFLRLGEGIADRTLEEVSAQCQEPEAVSDIMFTSGSTSRPKGVMLSHEMLLRSSFATCRCRNMEEGRRIFVPVPLFHLMAHNEALLPALYVGGCLILSERRYDPEHALELMRLDRANDIVCVASIMIDFLTKCSPRPEDYPDMHAAYWASVCPEWVWQAGKEAFGLERVSTGYGMTECASTTSIIATVDAQERVRSCHGRLKAAGAAGEPAFEGHLMQIRVCDEQGREVPVGICGELYCRGPAVTKGYYNDPEANERAFTPDGWFRTGDLVDVDGEGYLTYHGRNSDMYKINGENVSPQFVEQVLGASPLVAKIEVVGISHPKCGEIGVAFVEAPEEDAETLLAYCRSHLAGFQIPGYFIFSNSKDWPRTASGKVKKQELKRLAADHLNGGKTGYRIFDTRKEKMEG